MQNRKIEAIVGLAGSTLLACAFLKSLDFAHEVYVFSMTLMAAEINKNDPLPLVCPVGAMLIVGAICIFGIELNSKNKPH